MTSFDDLTDSSPERPYDDADDPYAASRGSTPSGDDVERGNADGSAAHEEQRQDSLDAAREEAGVDAGPE